MNITSPNQLPLINSHDSWSQLEEAWLGDVYPASWYDHLDPAVRDVFYSLTEITKQDLDQISSCMAGFGIKVRRPQYLTIDDFVENGHLVKPDICPRDEYVVIGNDLIMPSKPKSAWQHVIDEYAQASGCGRRAGVHHAFNGANIVRVGRDIIIDRDCFDYQYNNEFPGYRVRVVANGGHMDGCFAILKPGLLIANHYWDDYANTFPGWDIIMLNDPTYRASPSTGYRQPYPVYNGKFWNTGVGTNQSFNNHIIRHALDWVGCYTETYFELNCLVINTENVIMLAENEILARDLERHGIRVHWVPFRARSFWDGAMHCLTVDIRRQSAMIDYFPNRSS